MDDYVGLQCGGVCWYVKNLCMQARQLAAAAAELAESDKQKAKCVMLEGRAWHALRSAREAARCYTQACH